MSRPIFASLALLALLASPIRAQAAAGAFVFPSAPALGETEGKVSANLHGTYSDELKELKKDPSQLLARIRERNEKALKELIESDAPASTITLEQANTILKSVASHPVVGEAAVAKYDPERSSGFCFGRAAYVHMELLRRGVPARSLRKIFALGTLRAGSKVHWDFHVAVVVKTSDSRWLAIDDLAGRAMPVEEWMKDSLKYDKNPKEPRVRYYFTDPVKFQPLPGAYGFEGNLKLPYFHGYFDDLAKWFAKHPVTQ